MVRDRRLFMVRDRRLFMVRDRWLFMMIRGLVHGYRIKFVDFSV
jgi:hypothetical protein